MYTIRIKLLLVLALIQLSNFVVKAQSFDFFPADVDKGTSNIETYETIDDNSLIIVEKTNTKPMGLKPYLYSFENNQFSCNQIMGMKHMQVYKKFFTEGFRTVTIKGVHYRVITEYAKQKTNNHIYSLSLQKIDLETLEDVGEAITVIDNKETMNDGSFFFLSSGDYFAVIKSGQTGFSLMFDGEGADFFVFNANNLELLYEQSISYSSKEQSGKILEVRMNDEGKIFTISSKSYRKEKLNSADQPIGDLAVTEISHEGVNKVDLNSERVLNVQFIGADDSSPFVSTLKVSKKNDLVSLVIVSPIDGEILDQEDITLTEFLNPKHANSTKQFTQSLKKVDELKITAEPSTYSTYNLTTESGHTLSSYPIMIAPKVMWHNNLFCTLTALVDVTGQIKWTQVSPIKEALLTLLDKNNNVHLFANGTLNEYENGVFVGNESRGPNEQKIPVEVVLDGNSGEIVSNKAFESENISEKYIFSVFINAVSFNDTNGFIGMINKSINGANGLNNNVTFGHVKLVE